MLGPDHRPLAGQEHPGRVVDGGLGARDELLGFAGQLDVKLAQRLAGVGEVADHRAEQGHVAGVDQVWLDTLADHGGEGGVAADAGEEVDRVIPSRSDVGDEVASG